MLGAPLPNDLSQCKCVNFPITDDNDIEHMKMMQMPYLDMWSTLLYRQVPHRTNLVNCFGMDYSRKKMKLRRGTEVGST